jgi:hypothetical protein
MSDVDITSARPPGRSRTTSTRTRLMDTTSVAAVDIAPAPDGPDCGTAKPANPSPAAQRLNNNQQNKRAAYEPHLKERGLTPSRRSRKDLRSIVRTKPPPKRFRGVPLPLTFDLDALPASTLLNETETAAACRRAKATLEVWRTQPDHPLKWRRVGGRVLYELPSIRAFLKGAEK